MSYERSADKRWIFLSTCLTTRLLHFEVFSSMDIGGCVMGIGGSVNLRGIPGVIMSDIGTNFIATEQELPNIILNWNQQTLRDSLVKRGIKKGFHPPSAPHHGDIWE